jgi:mannitol-specific phosphotransferase system IIBC component
MSIGYAIGLTLVVVVGFVIGFILATRPEKTREALKEKTTETAEKVGATAAQVKKEHKQIREAARIEALSCVNLGTACGGVAVTESTIGEKPKVLASGRERLPTMGFIVFGLYASRVR